MFIIPCGDFKLILIFIALWIPSSQEAKINSNKQSSFPDSGWTKRSREPRLVPCLQNCFCEEVDNNHLIIDCSRASNSHELSNAFQTNFVQTSQHITEKSLVLMGTELDIIDSEEFGNVSFHRIHIKYNHGLCQVSHLSLRSSKATLNVLDLRNNNFSALPLINFTQFQSLQFISIDDNLIQEIPASLHGLDALIHLSIANNRVVNISQQAMAGMPKLEYLDLHGNLLSAIPNIFHKMPSLHSLILYGNPLKILPQGVFQNLPTLEFLDLSLCQLDVLENMQLQIQSETPFFLDLAGNPLTKLHISAFITDSFPLWLNLRGTKIEQLQEENFGAILEKMISTNIVHERFGHPQLFLEDTKLSCDCSLKWLATNSTLLDRTNGLCIHKKISTRRLDPDYFHRFCF